MNKYPVSCPRDIKAEIIQHLTTIVSGALFSLTIMVIFVLTV